MKTKALEGRAHCAPSAWPGISAALHMLGVKGIPFILDMYSSVSHLAIWNTVCPGLLGSKLAAT